MTKNRIVFTAFLFLISLSAATSIYADQDCGFDKLKEKVKRAINPQKYWQNKTKELENEIRQCGARIQSLRIDIKELKDPEYRRMRIRRAMLDSIGYGEDAETTKDEEIQNIYDEYDFTIELYKFEIEEYKKLQQCLKKANEALSAFN